MNINGVIGRIVNQQMKGKVKFKFLKLAKAVEPSVEVILTTLSNVSDPDEKLEIMEETQDIQLVSFTEKELEEIEMSLIDLTILEDLIEFEV